MHPLFLLAITEWLPSAWWQWVIILIAAGGLGVGMFLRNKARKAAGL